MTVKDGETGIFFVFCPKVYTRPHPNLQSLNLALKEQKSVHVELVFDVLVSCGSFWTDSSQKLA